MTLVWLMVAPLWAADRYVEVSGSDSANDCTLSGSPCRTLAAALSQSSADDHIYVGAGTFSSSALDVTIPLTIEGMGPDMTHWRDVGSGSFYSGGIRLQASTGVTTVTGMELIATNGNNSYGLHHMGAGDVILDDLALDGVGSHRAGIGLGAEGDVLLSNATFNNVDTWQAPLEIWAFSGAGTVDVDNVVISGDPARNGIWMIAPYDGMQMTLSNSTISDMSRGVQVESSSGQWVSSGYSFDLDIVGTDFNNLSNGAVNIETSTYGGEINVLLDDVTATQTGPLLVSAHTFGSSHNVSVTIDGLSTNGVDESIQLGGYEVDLYMADAMMTRTGGGPNLVEINGSGSAYVTTYLDGLTVNGGDAGIHVDPGVSGSLSMVVTNSVLDEVDVHLGSNSSYGSYLDLIVEDSDFTNAPNEALRVRAGSNGLVGVALDNTVIDNAGSVGAQVLVGSSGSASMTVDCSTITDSGGDGMQFGALGSGVQSLDLNVRTSRTAGNTGKGLAYQGGYSGNETLDIDRLLATDNGGAGVDMYTWGPGTRDYTMSNSAFLSNSTLSSSAYDVSLHFSSSSSLIMNAAENWFDETDAGLVEGARIYDMEDGYGLADIDVGTPRGELAFDVMPPWGNDGVDSVLLLVVQPGEAPFVGNMGDSTISASVGGQPAEVLWVDPDGSMMRIRRPVLPIGMHSVEVTNPSGQTGTFGTYEVVDMPDTTLDLRTQAWVDNTGTYIRVNGAPPNADVRLFLSPSGDGDRTCPRFISGGCLTIAEPFHVRRLGRSDASGRMLERIGPPNLPVHPEYVAVQAVAFLPGGDYVVSRPEVWPWLEPSGDADLDGVSNMQEHRDGTDAFSEVGCP